MNSPVQFAVISMAVKDNYQVKKSVMFFLFQWLKQWLWILVSTTGRAYASCTAIHLWRILSRLIPLSVTGERGGLSRDIDRPGINSSAYRRPKSTNQTNKLVRTTPRNGQSLSEI